jgi:predicted phosphodiesterase
LYTIEQHSEVAHGEAIPVLRLSMQNITKDWQQRFLLISDVHFDSTHCDRAMLKAHLDEAKDTGAGIISVGDWFDAMQSKQDPRHTKGDIRPEYKKGNYFDAIVDDSIAYLEPYRDSIVGLGDGNHETAVSKKVETDLTGRLARGLGVPRLGYSGFVQFRFQRAKTGGRTTVNMYYHHGSGGGGIMTKGTLRVVRQASWLPDAHILVSGHIHERWEMTTERLRCSSAGKLQLDQQIHLQLPTYKQEFDVTGGWHVQRGAPPKPTGGAWLTFYYDSTRTHQHSMTTGIRYKTDWAE